MSLKNFIFKTTGQVRAHATVPVQSVKKIEHTGIITITLPANLPANQTVVASFTLDPRYPSVSRLTIPKGETWQIEDIYITSAPSVDCIVRIVKNEREVIHITPPVSTLDVSNPARPRLGVPITFSEYDTVTIEAINLANVGSSDVTITLYVKVVKYVPS